MKSVSICHALEDRERARELARFIDVNFGFEIALDDAVVSEESDITAATGRAISANFAIVLFSPASVPAPLKREQWERAFVKAPAEYETPIAFALLRECPFPEVLRRAKFFDGSRDFLACMRGLKRWMLSLGRGNPAGSASPAPGDGETPDPAWRNVVDTPGVADGVEDRVAAMLMRQARDDFEETFRVRCAGRPLEIIVGELGRALGLKLPGPVEENRRALEWHAMARRYLIVLDGVAEDLKDRLRFGGRCSVAMTSGRGGPAVAPIGWQDVSIGNIGDAIEYALGLLAADPGEGGRLAARIVRVLSENAAFAEAALVLKAMRLHIPDRADWAGRELDWIQNHWGESVEIPPAPILDAKQMDLFGDGGPGDGGSGDSGWMAA